MKSKINLHLMLGLTGIFAIVAFTNASKEISNSKQDQVEIDSIKHTSEEQLSIIKNQLPKVELTSIYSLAIKQYIETVIKKDKIHFDTLYFGKHVFGQADDFPDIELPAAISNTQIRLIDPEIGATLQQKNNAMVYINMMGFVDQVNASFIMVNFSNGGQHQYDYFIDFDYNISTKEYYLTKIAMEDYRNITENKRKHISLYSEGKYTFE
jgi:hypothetical protein